MKENTSKGKQIMLKQKIADWREYKDAKDSVRLQYANFIEVYRDWEFVMGELVSVTKKKDDIRSAMQEPDGKLFGTMKYPCIVNHIYTKPFSDVHFAYPEELKETFYCKNYEKHSVCSNRDCLFYPDNLVAFLAWGRCQQAAEKVVRANERYKKARLAFLGEKLSNIR